MKNLNNKGFTLIEVLAVIVILAIIGGIAIPSVISAVNKGKSVSKKTMIDNIKTAAQELYEEIYFSDSPLYRYDTSGNKTNNEITINANDVIEVNLQTLVSNGFLNGMSDKSDIQKIIDPDTKEDLGDCEITITRNKDKNGIITYKISKSISETKEKCPNLEG